MREHIDKLHIVAKALVEREKIDADEFYMLMDGKELPPLQSESDKTEAKDDAQSAEKNAVDAAQPTETTVAPTAENTAETEQSVPNESKTPSDEKE